MVERLLVYWPELWTVRGFPPPSQLVRIYRIPWASVDVLAPAGVAPALNWLLETRDRVWHSWQAHLFAMGICQHMEHTPGWRFVSKWGWDSGKGLL